jgi:hypothetical protein
MNVEQTKVTIKVRDVGNHFGHEADVRQGRKLVHTTKLVSWGHQAIAYRIAGNWAAENGYKLQDEE